MGLIKLRIARHLERSRRRPASPDSWSHSIRVASKELLHVARHRTHTHTHAHSRAAARSRCHGVWHATPICRWPGLSTPPAASSMWQVTRAAAISRFSSNQFTPHQPLFWPQPRHLPTLLVLFPKPFASLVKYLWYSFVLSCNHQL